MSDYVCVLTGDLVKSSTLERNQLEAAMAAIEAAGRDIQVWPGAAGRQVERFQGDSWQFLLAKPRWALRASLVLRAAVRKSCDEADTRVAIGIGAARLADTLAASAGPAFELSGRGLESLKTHRYWAIDGEWSDAAEHRLAAGLFSVCDAVSQRWTARQADVFARLAGPAEPTMAEVAESLSVQPQTVQAHFAKAAGPALMEAIQAFESALDDSS